MRIFLTIALTLVLITATGCGSSTEEQADREQTPAATSEPSKVSLSPSEYVALAKQYESDKDRNSMYTVLTELKEFHPNAPEVNEVDTIIKEYDKALNEKARLAAEKKKAEEEQAQAEKLEAEKKAKAEKLNLLTGLAKDKDEVTGRTWYRHKTTTQYVDSNSIFAYFGITEDGDVGPLRLKIQYAGDSWVFIERYILRIDDTKETIEADYGDIIRDNDSTVWEYYDVKMDSDLIEVVKKIAASTKTIIRHEGRERYHDRTITAKEKTALSEIIDIYTKLTE